MTDAPPRPPDDGSDDPTHALDDFVRRMRPGAPPPDDLPDLSGLVARLHPERPSAAARPRGGTLRNGQTWDAADVDDVPVVELPRVAPARHDRPAVTLPPVDLPAEGAQAAQPPDITLPPVATPPPPDASALHDTTRQARDFAASQWDADADAAADSGWQPAPRALRRAPAGDPRLLAAWQPGAWTGAVRGVIGATTELVTTPAGPVVESYPPQALLLAWPPQPAGQPLGRWPQRLRLAAVPPEDAAQALLADLPPDARLWLLPAPDAVDWALAAEIVLHHEPALRPFQTDGLRTFIAAEREAAYARLNADYGQGAPGGAVIRR